MAIMRSGDREEPNMQDRNKTVLTHNITMGAIEHLRYIGVKAIMEEVPVASKWIADIAGLWSPTPTECLRAKLLPPRDKISRPIEFMGKTIDIPEDDPEQHWYETFGKLPWCITIVHEVKTSQSDFARDDKFTREPVADLQILSYPLGVLSEDKLPKNWWLWEHRTDGAVRKVSRYPKLLSTTDEKRFVIAASIAERQHNKVHNKFWNDLKKKQTLDEVEERKSRDLRRMADSVMRVAKGELSPTAVFETYFPRNRKRYEKEYIESMLTPLYGILKPSDD